MTANDPSQVLVVAAGTAWPFYRLAHAYVCQANRGFRPVHRIAFYSNRTIHGIAALIEEIHDDILLSESSAARLSLSINPGERRLGNVMAAALAGAWQEGERSKVFLLSGPDDLRTVRFDTVAHHGPTAWTMGQRYADLSRLQLARGTDDLVEAEAAHVAR